MSNLTEKIKISEKVIESALKIWKRPLILFSGGKDSTLVLYLVKKVCDRLNIDYPLVLIGDPFPIEENIDFCIKTIKELGYPKFIKWSDFLDEKCYMFYVEKSKSIEKCCYWCKIQVLNKIIKWFNIDLLFVGIRWDEHPTRSEDPYFRVIEKPFHIRCEPILHWNYLDILSFYRENPHMLNPLYLKGYTSLGCKPCTTPSLNIRFTSVEEYINTVKEMYVKGQLKERQSRVIDKEMILERLRSLGYL